MDKVITRDSNLIKVLVASAKKESQDTALLSEANAYVRELASDLSPENKYRIAQVIGFAVNDLMKPATNWLSTVADLKEVGMGEKAQFIVNGSGVKAFVQAKGATTARSKVTTRALVPETVDVSARPVINIAELRSGKVDMANLIVDAAYKMEIAEYRLIQQVLNAAATSWAAPYYGTGSGIVKATLDPMVRHWMRLSAGGSPVIIGDIEVIAKLAEQTGFTASSSAKQFSSNAIDEFHNAGFVGNYAGARVINLVNPLDDTDTPAFDLKKLYILPASADASARPLKIVHEGEISSREQENIDDMTYEVRLDRYVGAGLVFGERPNLSVYADSSN